MPAENRRHALILHCASGATADGPVLRVNRRQYIARSVAVAAALARQPAIGAPRSNARVGHLGLVNESDGERLYRDFIDGLQGRGYVQGRNLRMLRRSARAQPKRLRTRAAELASATAGVIPISSMTIATPPRRSAAASPMPSWLSRTPMLAGKLDAPGPGSP